MKRERVTFGLDAEGIAALDRLVERDLRASRGELMRVLTEDLLPVLDASNLTTVEFRRELIQKMQGQGRSRVMCRETLLRLVPPPPEVA
jgi:hypothetical protein